MHKKNRVYYRGLLILFFAFSFFRGEAQISYQLHKSRNETSWFVSGHIGMTSYLGDIARYGSDPIYKFKEESKIAYGLFIGKSFNQKFSGRLYFNIGGLKAYNNELSIRYDASMMTFGLQFMVNFYTLIAKMDYVPDFYIYGIAGAGSIMTKPVLYHINSDSLDITPIDKLNYAEKINSFEINGGLGVNMTILRNFDAFAELVYHYTMTDELDLTVDEKNDKYFQTLIGIRYRFAFAGNKGSSAFSRKRR